ncbi:MAG TPA: hypothetical protein VGK19_18135 [Capsulimonadaceae bacterium]|jgi:hypothetical protein
MASTTSTDKFGRTSGDVTDELRDMNLLALGGNIVKAERFEKNILILQRRPGGHWLINYWWTENVEDALDEVGGSETAKFGRHEIDPARSLFEQVNLF